MARNRWQRWWHQLQQRWGAKRTRSTSARRTGQSCSLRLEALEERLAPATWSGVIPDGTTWNNTEVQFITDDIRIEQGSTLNIQPGTIIKVGSDDTITVNGTLKALGTADQPITITSSKDDRYGGDSNNDGSATTPNRGDWRRLVFTGTSTGSELAHVQVLFGGTFGVVNAAVEAVEAAVSITDCLVSDSRSSGLYVSGADASVSGSTFQNNDRAGACVRDGGGSLVGCSFLNNTGAGLRLDNATPAVTEATLQGNGYSAVAMNLASEPTIRAVTVSGNRYDAVLLDSGTISANTSWANPEIVYQPADVSVPQGVTLTVGAGQIVKMAYDTGLTVNGTLKALGTAAQPITFTSYLDDRYGGDTNNDGAATTPNGDWRRILFNNTSTGNVLAHTRVFFGGQIQSAAVMSYGAPLTLTDSVFSGSYRGGVLLSGAGGTIARCTFENASRAGLRLEQSDATVTDGIFRNNNGAAISMDMVSQPVIRTLTASGNLINSVFLDEGTLPGNTTWNNPEVVYWLAGPITVPQGATLTVAPGQIVKMRSGYGLTVDGTLKAMGTADQPITFTSSKDDSAGGDTNNDGPSVGHAGDWGTLRFNPTSRDNVLDHVVAPYSGYNFGAIFADRCTLTVSNSVVRDSFYKGILIRNQATVRVVNTVIAHNGYEGVFAEDAGTTVELINNTIDGNYAGVYQAAATLTLVNNLITNNTNGFNSSGIVVAAPGPLTASFNDVFNNGVNWRGTADRTGTNGNISVDPKYFDAATGQYQLRGASPVIDAGTSDSTPTADLRGNPRFNDPSHVNTGGGAFPFTDLGAFERQETATSDVDLVTTAVSGPVSGLQGQSVTVYWSVTSSGSAPAIGSWYDAVYLSPSAAFTADAIPLGEVQHTGDLGHGQSYDATGTFTLPGVLPGNWYFLVRANARYEVFEGTALLNNIAASAAVAVDVPALTLGAPVTGELAATGARQVYKVTLPTPGDLAVTLTGSAGVTHELYLGFGDVPTRQSFAARSNRPGAADQTVSLAGAPAGTYYVVVYGASVPAPESFTLTADTVGFSLSGVSPSRGSNAGQVTFSFSGAGFDLQTQPRLVDSAGATIQPQRVFFTDTGRVEATFDLTGHPTGPADVQVVKAGATRTLAQAVEIVSGSPGRLSTNVTAPSSARLQRFFQITVAYANTGATDILAPVMRLEGTGLTLLSLFPDFRGATDMVDMIGINPHGPAGVLAPGAHGQITVYARTVDTGTDTYRLSIAEYPAVSINWSAVSQELRPVGVADVEWDARVAALRAQVGETWDRYPAVLANAASLLPASAGLNYSFWDVFSLVFRQATADAGTAVGGRILSADTGLPLGDVPVTFYEPIQQQSFEAVSLLDGSFLTPVLPAGTYDVRFEGYVSASPVQLTVGAGGLRGQELHVLRGATIAGGVVLADGTPAGGLLVSAVSDEGSSFAASTDRDGRYSLGSLPAGVYEVRVGGGLYTTSVVTGIRVGTGEVRGHTNFVLDAAATIAGTVLGPTGPLAGALVTATGADGRSASAVTSNTGAFLLDGLSGQTYTLQATSAGLARAAVAGVNVPARGAVTGVSLSLGAAGSVVGRITAASDGSSLASMSLTLKNGQSSFSVLTDADGNFSFADVPPGTYTLTTADARFQTTSALVAVQAGATATANLSVAPRGRIVGDVTNSANSTPVPHVTVYVASAGSFVASALTDDDGSYELAGLDAGTYQVILGDALTPGLRTTTATVDASHATVTVDFVVSLAGVVSGTVFRADGQSPLGDATVAVVQDGQVLLSMTTADDGVFIFDLVAAGTYQLEARFDGLAFPVITSVDVSGGITRSGLNFTVGSELLSGLIVDDASGLPLGGATVLVTRTDAGLALPATMTALTADDGTFSLTTLIPGAYRVMVQADGHAFAGQDVQVVAGTPAAVTLRLLVESTLGGVVRDAVTGAPLADAVVVLSTATGPAVTLTATTDAAGSYRFMGLAQTTYDATLFADGYESAVRQVLVGQGNGVANFGLGQSSIRVSGTVSSGGRALPQVLVTARDANGFTLDLAMTGPDGGYELLALPPGSYTLSARGQGFQASGPVALTVGRGDNVGGFNLDLAAVGITDPTINPDFLPWVDSFQQPTNHPVELERFLKAVPVQGYLLTAADKKLLFEPGNPLCEAERAAAVRAVREAERLFKDLQTQQPQLQASYAKFQEDILAISVLLRSVRKALKGIEALEKLLGNLNPEVGNLLSSGKEVDALLLGKIRIKPAELLPSQFDITAVDEVFEAAVKILNFGVNDGDVTPDTKTRFEVTGRLLNSLASRSNGSLSDLTNKARTLSALLNKATGRSLTKLGDLGSVTVFKVEKDPQTGEETETPKSVPLSLLLSFVPSWKSGSKGAAGELSALADQVAKLAQVKLFENLQKLPDLLQDASSQVGVLAAYEKLARQYSSAVDNVFAKFTAYANCDHQPPPPPAGCGGEGELNAPHLNAPDPGTDGFSYALGVSCPDKVHHQDDPGGGAEAPSNHTGGQATTDIGAARDPNDLIGPAGFGSQHFIQPGTLAYEVQFENDPAHATAAAQIVAITLTLDDHLDPATFQFTGFGFGNRTFTVPAGLAHYETTLDLRPDGVNLLVPVRLDLDFSTRVVTVTLASLDPLSRQAPDGVDDGFLPVNNANHDGEGFFTYTVEPLAGLPTGTVISAQASIVFDTNAAILTPTAFNTLDVGAPTSSVTALPTTVHSTTFAVTWSGQDDAGGAGIVGYDVYFSDNDGPYQQLAQGTLATSALFQGQAGHRYTFYSRAIDGVGHRQADITTVSTRIEATFGSRQSFTDTDGDIYTIKLKGAGQLGFVPNAPNGRGPIGALLLEGTDSTRSKLSVTVKKAGTGDGRVALESLTGNAGLKSILASASDLVGGGIQVSGPLGSLALRTVNAATIAVPRLGTLTVSGDFAGTLTLTGVGLNKATIAGTVRDSTITAAGTVNSFTTAAFIRSQLLVGFLATDPDNPLAGGTFTATAQLNKFVVLGKANSTAPAFVDSYVAAASLGKVTLKSVQTSNGGRPFGLLAQQVIARLKVTSPRLVLNQVTASPDLSGTFEDFVVRLA